MDKWTDGQTAGAKDPPWGKWAGLGGRTMRASMAQRSGGMPGWPARPSLNTGTAPVTPSSQTLETNQEAASLYCRRLWPHPSGKTYYNPCFLGDNPMISYFTGETPQQCLGWTEKSYARGKIHFLQENPTTPHFSWGKTHNPHFPGEKTQPTSSPTESPNPNFLGGNPTITKFPQNLPPSPLGKPNFPMDPPFPQENPPLPTEKHIMTPLPMRNPHYDPHFPWGTPTSHGKIHNHRQFPWEKLHTHHQGEKKLTWHSGQHGEGTYLAFGPSWTKAAALLHPEPWTGPAAAAAVVVVAASTGDGGGGPAPSAAAAPSAACAAWSADPKSHVAVGGGWGGRPLPPAPVHPVLPPLSLARRRPGSHTHTQHSLRGPPFA